MMPSIIKDMQYLRIISSPLILAFLHTFTFIWWNLTGVAYTFLIANGVKLVTSLVKRIRMQWCVNVFTGVYKLFLLGFHCCIFVGSNTDSRTSSYAWWYSLSNMDFTQGLYSLSRRTSYRKIPQVSKPRNSSLDCFNRAAIWHAPR